MNLFNADQRKFLANFFSGMAIIWFAAAFLRPANAVLFFESIGSGLLALNMGMWLLREVENK